MAKGASSSAAGVASVGARVGGGAAPKISLGGGPERGSGFSVAAFSSKGPNKLSPESSGRLKTNRYGPALTSMTGETFVPRISIDKSVIPSAPHKFGRTIEKPDPGTAKMTRIGQQETKGEQNLPTNRPASMSVDRLQGLVRQPDATVFQLQRTELNTPITRPRIIEKGTVNLSRKAQSVQRLRIEEPRRNTMPEVKPRISLVEPVLPLEVVQAPVVEQRPNLLRPTLVVPDRAVEQNTQALATVREKLKAEQMAPVEKAKPFTQSIPAEGNHTTRPRLAIVTETARPPVSNNVEVVAKNKKIVEKSPETFKNKLARREAIKVELGIVPAEAQPQEPKLKLVEEKDEKGYVAQRILSSGTGINVQEKEEERIMRLKRLMQVRLRKLLLLRKQTEIDIQPLTQLQQLDQKRTQAVQLETPSVVQPEATKLQVLPDNQAAKETTVQPVLLYKAGIVTQIQPPETAAQPESTQKKETKVIVYEEAQKNKLRQWFDAVASIFPAFDSVTTRSPSEVVAVMEESNYSTRSHDTLLKKNKYDGADTGPESFRSKLARIKAKVTASIARMIGAEAIHDNPAGIVKESDEYSTQPDLKEEQVIRIVNMGEKQAKVAA